MDVVDEAGATGEQARVLVAADARVKVPGFG
jgi:hypothetical protein